MLSVAYNFSRASKGESYILWRGSVLSLFTVLAWYGACSSALIEGGLPFLRQTWNQKLGRAGFGFAGFLTAACAVYFFFKGMNVGEDNSAQDPLQ